MSDDQKEEGENPHQSVYEKAYAVALRIVKAYKYLYNEKKEYVLSKQLLRSGTAIAANLFDLASDSPVAEPSASVSIAYNESRETKYWLSLMKDTGYIDEKSFESIYADVDEVFGLLSALLHPPPAQSPPSQKKKRTPSKGDAEK